MNDLERQLGDAVAEDRMTGADAEHVRTFAQFLAETPAGVVRAITTSDEASAVVSCFADHAEFAAWRHRWLPYLAGQSTEPTDGATVGIEVDK